MASDKMKAILFTTIFVLPLSYLYKFFYPETRKLTGFFLIISLLIIFHSIASWVFSRPKRVGKK